MSLRPSFRTAFVLAIQFLVSLASLAAEPTSPSASSDPIELTVIERGAHHRIVEWLAIEKDEAGNDLVLTNSYTELSTGLHYVDGTGSWAETVAAFTPVAGGFIADRGPHQVALGSDLTVAGAVTVVTPEGQTLRSTPTLLAFEDRLTGASIRLADLKSSTAELVAPNVVLWADTFDTIAADVRASYTASGFECDVILRRQLPDPTSFGLDPETTEVAVYTEFFDTEPTAVTRFDHTNDGETPLTDVRLDFLSMAMDHGKAFRIDGSEGTTSAEVPVRKSWEVIEGRRFLVERTSYRDLQPLLQDLPEAVVPSPSNRRSLDLQKRTARLDLPAVPVRGPSWPRSARGRLVTLGPRAEFTPLQASLVGPAPGVVLDYTVVYTTTNGYTFGGLSTYYVSGPVNLSGLVTFNAGTVIKFANTNSPALNLLSGTTNVWLGEPYRPVVLTAKDDNSVGEPLPGSTGTPSGTYAAKALNLIGSGLTAPLILTNLTVRYAAIGVAATYYGTAGPLTIRHAQFLHCPSAVKFQLGGTNTYFIQNALLYATNSSAVAFRDSYYAHVQGSHLTVDGYATLRQTIYGPDYSSVGFTNSVLAANVTSTNGVSFVSSYLAKSGDGQVFETAGGGLHYLNFSNSTVSNNVINAADFDIDNPLQTELTFRHVNVPQTLSGLKTQSFTPTNVANSDLNYGPRTANKGYHYSPIDYLVSGLVLSNATLTLNARYLAFTTSPGIILNSGGNIVTPNVPPFYNRLTWYAAVQEQPLGSSDNGSSRRFVTLTNSPSAGPDITLRFTRAEFMADTANRRILLDDGGFLMGDVSLRDNEIAGAKISLAPVGTPGAPQTFGVTNNIFDQCDLVLSHYYDENVTASLFNNLFIKGSLALDYFVSANNPQWTTRDNLFCGTTLTGGGTYVSGGYNGYTAASAYYRGSGNKLSLTQDWAGTGPLGPYYYPTAGTNLATLANSGSRAASAAGLYHYTTRIDQAKEGYSQVDIGYHYIALSDLTYLKPTDSDNDLLPDYLEDVNGDGTAQDNEFDWSSLDTDGDFVTDLYESSAYLTGGVVSWGSTNNIPDVVGNPASNTTYISVAAGHAHSLGLRIDGSIFAWGSNTYGQTSIPATTNTYMSIGAGERHSIALTEQGAVVAWGNNSYGQTNLPSSNTNFVAVAACYRHNLALKANGTVVAWGDNAYNQTNVPSGLTNVDQVAVGQEFSLARRSNGTVVGWGRNDNYSQTNISPSATNVVEIAAGYTHALALRSDGVVIGWGDNTAGAATVPIGLSNVLHIAAGKNFSLALKNDGVVVAWGDNTYGLTNVPTSLTGNVQAVVAGYRHAVGLPRAALMPGGKDVFDYPVDVKRDFLVVANSAYVNSTNVANYYLSHRPGLQKCTNLVLVNLAAVGNDAFYTSVDSAVITPIKTWLTNNPTKRPRYILFSSNFPQRMLHPSDLDINGYPKAVSSLQYRVRSQWPGYPPLIGSLNMREADCTNYVNKLSQLGGIVPRIGALLSASRKGYSNQLLCLDNVGQASGGFPIAPAGSTLAQYAIPSNDIRYASNGSSHISQATNVGAYVSWGGNSTNTSAPFYDNTWVNDGTVIFSGNSAWWIMQSIESWNGIIFANELLPNPRQGSYQRWFFSSAFGGTNSSATPVGGVQHVSEPNGAVNDTTIYFGLWYHGQSLGVAAWASARTDYHSLTGDPLVSR